MTTRIDALSNPEMLQWARESFGLTVEEAARKVPVKPERLERWERGDLRPTIAQLRKLAGAYKRPLACFFLEQAPPAESFPRDFRRLDPEVQEPLSPALRLAIRQARRRRQNSLELLQELGERPPDFSLRAHVHEDPEQMAERLRKALHLQTEPPAVSARHVFNRWREAAESAGILVFQAEKVGVGEARGFSLGDKPLPVAVVNIQDGPQLQR